MQSWKTPLLTQGDTTEKRKEIKGILHSEVDSLFIGIGGFSPELYDNKRG